MLTRLLVLKNGQNSLYKLKSFSKKKKINNKISTCNLREFDYSTDSLFF